MVGGRTGHTRRTWLPFVLGPAFACVCMAHGRRSSITNRGGSNTGYPAGKPADQGMPKTLWLAQSPRTLAIDRRNGALCFTVKSSSSNFSPYMDSPPAHAADSGNAFQCFYVFEKFSSSGGTGGTGRDVSWQNVKGRACEAEAAALRDGCG